MDFGEGADFVGDERSVDDHGRSVHVRLGDMGKRRLDYGSQEGNEARDQQPGNSGRVGKEV